MPTALSKFASNQVDSATARRFPLMTLIVNNAHAGFTTAAASNTAFAPALAAITTARTNWLNGMVAISNAEADQLSKTSVMENKLASLTHKPDSDHKSILEHWEYVILGVAPKGSGLYTLLLPHGRETLTRGSIADRVNELQSFTARLAAQTDQDTLTSLAAEEVLPFAEAAKALREAQEEAMTTVEEKRGIQEALRKAAAAEIYSGIGQGMSIFKDTPERVDELFDVDLLRGSSQEIPAAPIDTAWDPSTRILSVTEMPAGATHLVAYRQGEGGAPELLATGGTDELSVFIPSSFTFDPGESYDLWIVGKNGRGMGPAGPVVVWEAP